MATRKDRRGEGAAPRSIGEMCEEAGNPLFEDLFDYLAAAPRLAPTVHRTKRSFVEGFLRGSRRPGKRSTRQETEGRRLERESAKPTIGQVRRRIVLEYGGDPRRVDEELGRLWRRNGEGGGAFST